MKMNSTKIKNEDGSPLCEHRKDCINCLIACDDCYVLSLDEMNETPTKSVYSNYKSIDDAIKNLLDFDPHVFDSYAAELGWTTILYDGYKSILQCPRSYLQKIVITIPLDKHSKTFKEDMTNALLYFARYEKVEIPKLVDIFKSFNNQDQTAKADEGKLELRLVPRQIIKDIAEVRMYGNKKYHDPDNWKTVEKYRYVDALLRHLLLYLDDPDGVDEESGIKHYKHMACNMAFICEMEEKK